MSVKLTNDMRERILSKIMDDAFKDKLEAIEKKRKDFSVKVYNDIYSQKERDAMQSLPNGWLPESDNYVVQFGSQSHGYCHRTLPEKVRFLSMHMEWSRSVIKVYEHAHPLTIEHDKITNEKEAMGKEYNETKAQALAIINSCNTTKQLKDAWVEISPIVENYEPSAERQCKNIIPIIGDLNKRLNLSKPEIKD